MDEQQDTSQIIPDGAVLLRQFEDKAEPNTFHLIGFDYTYTARPREWENSVFIKRLSQQFVDKQESYISILNSFLAYKNQFVNIPVKTIGETSAPQWVNGWFPGLDAIALYSYLVQLNPPIYLEIGSGNSTAFARQAISDHGLQTRIISIDPHPRKEIDTICDEVVRLPLEMVDQSFFNQLTGKDLLFLDSSHRAFQNSDVTVFFVEILGGLPSGLLFGIHDIFLPRDYWGNFIQCFYNEQYMLACYLAAGGGGDEIVLPINYISHEKELYSVLDPIWTNESLKGIEPFGCAFWMRKA